MAASIAANRGGLDERGDDGARDEDEQGRCSPAAGEAEGGAMDELLLVPADSRRGTRASRRRGAMDREDGARGREDPGGGDSGRRAEEELLSCGLDRGKEEDLVVAGWWIGRRLRDWPDGEFKGEEVGGSGRIPMRGWRRPKGKDGTSALGFRFLSRFRLRRIYKEKGRV